ncbi:hypothetical protein SHI21_12785 [Bacteriovorax sp. PP10]|uniref:Uncharacterized protein n=1 Tax=Bacteriovorax antarcticus TaxID=3088717 RepID=A0ABU5VVK8_9BACT|nr:hypothetical protein [Bacteriovorax sp. PP10]MEA9357093.1 hypothetical protein [Bacteriovorax sp. PP10]
MDDIFDDVDSILDGDVSSEEETTNFNESELHDIMSEIEDLEKEFEAEDVPMTLQEKIDAELAMELEEAASETSAVVEATPLAEVVETKAQVLAFEKVAPVAVATPSTNTSSGVSFAAHGQMSLNLDFMVGQETAKLTIDPVKGLVVTLSGVELCISEDSGCTVSMENGMKFTIPLTSSANSTKKKSA